mmetsp:Transcript_27529/g.65297  ORF Transcript_27529/g.65297 Transcript_27529/m.65297 type:complete len:210 (+) Transcript_27529:891-1520(+)
MATASKAARARSEVRDRSVRCRRTTLRTAVWSLSISTLVTSASNLTLAMTTATTATAGRTAERTSSVAEVFFWFAYPAASTTMTSAVVRNETLNVRRMRFGPRAPKGNNARWRSPTGPRRKVMKAFLGSGGAFNKYGGSVGDAVPYVVTPAALGHRTLRMADRRWRSTSRNTSTEKVNPSTTAPPSSPAASATVHTAYKMMAAISQSVG